MTWTEVPHSSAINAMFEDALTYLFDKFDRYAKDNDISDADMVDYVEDCCGMEIGYAYSDWIEEGKY